MKTLIQNQPLSAHTQPLQPEAVCNFLRGLAEPHANVIEGSDGSFYGTISEGGSSGNPVLLPGRARNALAFSWIGPGFRLQRNPDLSSSVG